jgi:TPR repeat protein
MAERRSTGLQMGATDGWLGGMSRNGLAFLAMAVGIMAMSGCALQTTGMPGKAAAHYRSGLRALVAEPPDHEKVLSHFREAAIRDHAEAQRQLGRMYASLSPQPDLVRGYLWLFLASRSDPEAQAELSYLTLLMTREQVDAARALAAGFVPGQAPDEPPEVESPDAPAAEAAVSESDTKARSKQGSG